MSSILKALKKLEKDAPQAPEKVDAPAWLNREEKRQGQGGHGLVDAERVLGPRGRTFGFVGKIIAASVFMGIALGAMALWNAYAPSTDPGQGALRTLRPKTSPPVSVPVAEERRIAAVPREVKPEPKAPVRPRSVPRSVAAPKPSAATASATGKEAPTIPSLPKPETAQAPLPKPAARAALTPPDPQIKPKQRAALREESPPAAAPNPFTAPKEKTVSPEKELPQIAPKPQVPIRTEPRIALSRLKQVEEEAGPPRTMSPAAVPVPESADPILPAEREEMPAVLPATDPAPPRAQVELPSPAESLAAVSPAFAAVEQRTDPRFQIQALVWAEDPVARMAMVNGRIAKIGSVIDGVSIRHIGNDFILFEEGENRWKHPFRVQ